MGMGDAKLVFFLGLSLGALAAVAIICALAVGSCAGLLLILRDGSGARKSAIPFAPFLALGSLVAIGVAGAGTTAASAGMILKLLYFLKPSPIIVP